MIRLLGMIIQMQKQSTTKNTIKENYNNSKCELIDIDKQLSVINSDNIDLKRRRKD